MFVLQPLLLVQVVYVKLQSNYQHKKNNLQFQNFCVIKICQKSHYNKFYYIFFKTNRLCLKAILYKGVIKLVKSLAACCPLVATITCVIMSFLEGIHCISVKLTSQTHIKVFHSSSVSRTNSPTWMFLNSGRKSTSHNQTADTEGVRQQHYPVLPNILNL